MGYRIRGKTKSAVNEWKKSALEVVQSYSDEFVDTLGKLFAERARENLARLGYNTAMYATSYNIYYDSKYKQVVVRRPSGSDEPDIMWYLEFGTGIAGKNNPHPDATRIGWQYAVKESTVGKKGSPWRTNSRHEDGLGWWVSTADKDNVYHAEKDSLGYRRPHFFTSGIPPVRYLYTTMQEIDSLIEMAKQEIKGKRD